mmetsp:Transcript_25336/g.47112  ORF Transcript_25336/g.47112 Transcript_25336/m.47112 type:complete len:220 (-) Transcript_25336:1056-1715(-)
MRWDTVFRWCSACQVISQFSDRSDINNTLSPSRIPTPWIYTASLPSSELTASGERPKRYMFNARTNCVPPPLYPTAILKRVSQNERKAVPLEFYPSKIAPCQQRSILSSSTHSSIRPSVLHSVTAVMARSSVPSRVGNSSVRRRARVGSRIGESPSGLSYARDRCGVQGPGRGGIVVGGVDDVPLSSPPLSSSQFADMSEDSSESEKTEAAEDGRRKMS